LNAVNTIEAVSSGISPRPPRIGAIHQPWTAKPTQLSAAGVTLGRTYPQPIVDHAKARLAALAAYRRLSGKESGPEPSLFGE